MYLVVVRNVRVKSISTHIGWGAKMSENVLNYVIYGWPLIGKAKLVKTSVILNDLNPKWNESYRTEVCHFADHLSFEIRDKVSILG